MPSPRHPRRLTADGLSAVYERPHKDYAYGGDPPPLPAWYAELRARVDARLAALREEEAGDA